MKPLITTLLAAAAAFALSGCPAKDAKDGAANIQRSTGVNCTTERRMLQTAIESYSILENKTPVTEAEMVPDYLHADSPYFDIDATGQIVPSPGSTCN
ncbi:MAG: hypothetical protein Q8M22_08495 [Actinomycetota bacterium]|nr:hypothetical protein [Actinomycetota bacterium]